jgi:hypothetical protein
MRLRSRSSLVVLYYYFVLFSGVSLVVLFVVMQPRTEGTVLLETSLGVIAIELYWAHAPRTCQVKRAKCCEELHVVGLFERVLFFFFFFFFF